VVPQGEFADHFAIDKGFECRKREAEVLALLPRVNSQPCPGCGTLDSKICELLENFNQKVCQCKSSKCNNRYYCLTCGYEVSEGKFGNHFDMAKEFEC
jgi:hypothetical protein